MEKFWNDQAAQRLDSVGPDFEEYFDINGDDEGSETFSKAVSVKKDEEGFSDLKSKRPS
jgi:hypothetical protein